MSIKKSKLLLHICCGVCGAWVPKELAQNFDVALYFFNPNIYPRGEYERRFLAAQRVADEASVELIKGLYDEEKWRKAVRGYENEPEGGKRCEICFDYRLRETARYAEEHGFEYFATTLTMGRNKKALVINPIGEKLAKEFSIKFLAKDFKKGGGQAETDRVSHRLNLYRQNYCGCVYSKR